MSRTSRQTARHLESLDYLLDDRDRHDDLDDL
jgi:hypothetical protein